MKNLYLFFMLLLSSNLYAVDITTEVSKQVGYGWKNKVELTEGWLFVYLTETNINKNIYSYVMKTGVCILELESYYPGLLESVSKIIIQDKNGKFYAFNGGADECKELNKAGLGKEGDAYLESKTWKK